MNRRNPERMLEFFSGIRDCLLIVEGKSDVKALNTLGLKNILAINGRPLAAIVDMVAGLKVNYKVHAGGEATGETGISDIIVLTDFDREGRHIAARLSKLLRAHKIHPNQRLRSRIMDFGFNKIEDIKMDSILRMGECMRATAHNRVMESPTGKLASDRKVLERIRGDDYVKTGSNFNKIRDKGFDKGKGRSGKAGHHRRGVRPD